MSNPVLRNKYFDRDLSSAEPMTISGSINKAAFLLALCAGSACLSWGASPVFAIGGLIIGFILCLVICFKPQTSPILAPLYAIAEGMLLGCVSSLFEGQSKGIVIQAILLTAGVFCAMLGAYQTRLIQPTRKFVAVVVGATAGIALFYIASIVLGLFGIQVPFIHSGPYAILFSLFVCVIAALNLIIDFAVIEEGANAGAPKYMEWYAGFGLLVTLVWLYLEILRLLMKLRR
jgi:uncharacterized YccA/Bax inhibitor family protein